VPVQIAASPLQTDGAASICMVASDLTELEASANSIRVLREHQQAVEESESRFRAIFESSRDAIVIANDEGVYVQANPAVEAVFGLTTDQLIGRRVSEFLREDIDFPAWWQHFLATGRFHGEMPMIRADDELRYVESDAVANIRPGRHLFVIRDVTERKHAREALQDANERLQEQTEELRAQTEELEVRNDELTSREEQLKAANDALQESESRYRDLVENANSAIIRWRKDGTVTFFNEYAQNLFGYSQGEAIGKHVSFLLPEWESTGADVRSLVEDVVEHPELYVNHVNENVCRDGQRVWMNWTNRPIFDETGQVAEVLAVGTDVTARREAEESLRNLNTTLESKVAQRTAELEHRARQLQKLALELSQAEDAERKRLAEILHDDLQQIMAAAKFHLSIVRSRAKHDPSQQALADEVDRMLAEAIQKSRDLSHELSPIVLHHGDLTETLQWLANEIQAKHGMIVGVETHGDTRLRSAAVKAFLFKAAQELLFNVVKHAHVSEARIRARCLNRCVCLSVSDQGRGFDPSQLQKAAGLGLLSIRERVELLGGRMTIKSAPGLGTTFSIVIPDADVPESGAELMPQANGDTTLRARMSDEPEHRLRVLLADDHEVVREGLMFLLCEEHSIEVVGQAANGREAIDLTDRLRPDVVIMDVSMPLINGDEATRQIKRHLPQTRVIALSMHDERESVEKMLTAGAEAYVLKTSPSEELLAAIRGDKLRIEGSRSRQ
jgi:PAS domain S-box-containing protein